ncbi:MAG TPA: alpha/beta hydrolase [Oceanospirillales bacterium]|nr:alpha/beta hydrolase [Oceanospirillales bacterium]
MRVIFKPILAGCLTVLILSGCTSLTRLYFQPQTVWVQTPERAGIEYRDVWLTAADGTQLHAWLLLPSAPADEPHSVVLYLHGNGENISTHTRSVFWLAQAGYPVLALDYRGYGASQGVSLMPSVLQDVVAAADWLRTAYPGQQLVVLGQSMGAALAVDFVAPYGAHFRVDLLIADAPFSGFRSIAADMLQRSWIGYLLSPLTLLIPTRWDPVDAAVDIRVPTLILHSPDDRIIPQLQGRTLAAAVPEPYRCFVSTQGPHIATFHYPQYREIAAQFIRNGECPATLDSVPFTAE